jgi:tRNA(Ile)-lysidine synthase TilS/MesJ
MTGFDSHHLVPSKVFRPLLNLNKEEILTHCKQIGLPYFEDKTNNSPNISKRNKLRNTILPLLFKESNSTSNKTNTFFESMKNIYQSLENTATKKENKKT